METVYQKTVRMPEHALSYLINGDSSGIEESDIKAIDSYMSEFEKIAESYKSHVIISLSEEEPNFEPFPAFGSACNVVDCDIIILA